MKNLILITALSIMSFSVYSQTDLTGRWNTGNHNTLVKIEQQNGVYTGKIVSSDNPKAEPGKIIIKNIKAQKDGWSGKLYAAKRGEWYDAEINRSTNKLIIEISVGFFSKTVEWSKHNIE